MSAQIFTLQNARRGRVTCPYTGVVFPQLYRLTGMEWDLRNGAELRAGCFIESEDDLVASDRPVAPSYTLEFGSTYADIAHPQWQPIDHLDPAIDRGWVMVRHHRSKESLEAYIDAMLDTEPHEFPFDRWKGFETNFGLFSVLHRLAPTGAPDHLVVYTTKRYDQDMSVPMDWQRVIGPRGELRSPDDLFPPDEQGAYDTLMNVLNEQ